MPLSSVIRKECPKCSKVAVEKSRLVIGDSTLITLQCGHLMTATAIAKSENEVYESIVSADGYKLRDYQINGVKFLEQSEARAIIADEQGLGKTIQVLSLLRLHTELLPAVIVCPTTVKRQWFFEVIRWCGQNETFTTQVINRTDEIALPGFGVYIVTYDVLKKFTDMFALCDYHPIKTLFLDECQRIKNHLSDRAIAVQRFVKHFDIQHIVPMSGTPIKNNAGEYFTVLNLVAPYRFHSWQRFVNEYCDTYDGGWGTKVGGIADIDYFKENTSDLIIRRTKSEVLKDLPPLDRKFFHVDLDRRYNKAYAKALDELDEVLYAEDVGEFERSSNILAVMSRLRHITGLSKVDDCVNFVAEFLLSNDRKIVVFVHHQDVATLIHDKISALSKDGGFLEPLNMHSGLNGDARAELVERFKLPGYRVMIASTLAAGEGLNLQFCSDAIMLERQWNPANEEQGEGRFHRFGQQNNVSVTYMLASGTIDEYFTELVEIKRGYVAGALDGKEIQWNEQSLVKELAQILVSRGREKWKL